MADDDVPAELTQVDPWGGQIMARYADGWCDQGSGLAFCLPAHRGQG